MWERRNSIANALELRLSCTNPSICAACPKPKTFQSTSIRHRSDTGVSDWWQIDFDPKDFASWDPITTFRYSSWRPFTLRNFSEQHDTTSWIKRQRLQRWQKAFPWPQILPYTYHSARNTWCPTKRWHVALNILLIRCQLSPPEKLIPHCMHTVKFQQTSDIWYK